MVKYVTFSVSAKGISHEKRGLPCQDASLGQTVPDAGGLSASLGQTVADAGGLSVIAIADGHGSSRCFRSDIGARIAVEAALDGIINANFEAAYTNLTEDLTQNEAIIKKALGDLSDGIVSTWSSKVSEHESDNPLAEDQRIESLDAKYRMYYVDDTERRYIGRAYGTTLIAAAAAESYWLGIQIGDGKCVTLYDDGELEQPLPWDDNCFLNSTTSICDDDSRNEFRYWFGYKNADGSYTELRYGVDGRYTGENITRRPVAIFIGSDGVDDTYPVYENEKHLKNLYRNVAICLADNSFDAALPQISDLAVKLATHGSGDDVSICGIVGDLRSNAGLADMLKRQAQPDRA